MKSNVNEIIQFLGGRQKTKEFFGVTDQSIQHWMNKKSIPSGRLIDLYHHFEGNLVVNSENGKIII